MKEIWKRIEFEGKFYFYEVSNKGNARSIHKNTGKIRPKKSSPNSRDYYCLTVTNTRKKINSFLIHRLVAGLFIPNPLNLRDVNHKDFNKSNNHVDNLEWVSHKENIQHAMKGGRFDHLIGQRNYQTNFSNKDIVDIRLSRKTPKELACIYNVHITTIKDILKRKTWKHV